MREEVIALVPVLLVLTRRLGFEATTAVSMSIGAAAVGAAFSPINPFQVGIAQKLAEIPMLSGSLLGLPRQVTVLAYQYGAGLCELLTPTNGALMAILATAGVRYEQWLKFALPVSGLVHSGYDRNLSGHQH